MMKRSKSDAVFDGMNVAVMVVLLVLMLYPLYYIVIASVSEPYAVATGKIFLRPVGFTMEAYQNVFENQRIWTGYRNTVFYTIFGTVLNLVLTIPTAYVLSKKQLPARNLFAWYFLIPMYFSGGLIPTYLLVRDLHLLNTPYTIVVLGGLSIYNMVVTRTYFSNSIPGELYESARIDGATEFTSFFKIALPLATPIIAVMTLYYGVARWNDYYTAMIYISSSSRQPLQMVLRDILLQNQNALVAAENLSDEEMELMARRAYMAEAMKYAVIFIASAPLLCAYPFVQKYFVKGMMIGSLKG